MAVKREYYMSKKSVLVIVFLLLWSALDTLAEQSLSSNKQDSMAYQDVLGSINQRVLALEKLVAKARADDWLIRDKLASAYLAKASLTNSFADYSKAEELLNVAISSAPKGSGPLLTAAKMHYSLHRLTKSEELLEQIANQKLLKVDKRIALLALNSNIKFQRGEYQQALNGYQECERYSPGACLTDLAIYHSKTGGLAEARSIFTLELLRTDKSDYHRLAWLNLQLGILDLNSGDYPASIRYLTEADRIMPDWWLVREHIAEVQNLLGNTKVAIDIYKDVISKTELPQYMDALAEIYESQGEIDAARTLYERAEKLWERDITKFPEAASGHALDHYKLVGKNQDYLRLALANYKNRPNGEAGTILAEAYLLNGNSVAAKAQIGKVVASPFKNTDSTALNDTLNQKILTLK